MRRFAEPFAVTPVDTGVKRALLVGRAGQAPVAGLASSTRRCIASSARTTIRTCRTPKSFGRWTLVSSVAASLALVLASSAGAQTRVLPPGLEDEVAALVFAGDHGRELEGARVVGARIEGAHIDVELDAGGERGRARLVERGASSDGLRVGDTPSFTIFLIEGQGDASVRGAANALRARIAARDDGRFFEANTIAATEAAPRQRETAASLPWVIGAAAGLGLVVALALVVWRRRARSGAPG